VHEARWRRELDHHRTTNCFPAPDGLGRRPTLTIIDAHLGGNFRVHLGETELGFAEVGPLTVRAERNRPVPDAVVLRRAVTGATDLWDWHARAAHTQKLALDVVIELCDATWERIVARWVLVAARPVRWTGPRLDANTQEVAMEEIELVGERLEWRPLRPGG
jgi:phage tail-like protein